MTLSPWIIYLWGIADNLRQSCAVSSIGTGILAVVFAVVIGIHKMPPDISEPETYKMLWRWVRLSSLGCFFSALVYSLLPSSKVIAVMLIVPAIINSEPIQKDSSEIYQMAKDALKQTLQPSK